LRLGLTAAIGGVLTLAFPVLSTPTYFLTLGIAYLVNLTVETWLIIDLIQKSGRLSASS
jgi:hypothetical protein